ncbi:DUF711 family protein [Kingella potus]|uniref:DUF711 family protein n=1 Tax=Kingella potus TaxID=265175 RepID=UPI001FD46361|nr:DUF711 family protein [Kingella potus]UOP01754.1 DUF711 family protein [Kingella potus]
MTANLQSPALCRVRTVTAFTTLPPDSTQWENVLADAEQQCRSLAAVFQTAGYTVQTLRIVSNPFGEYLDTGSPAAARSGFAAIRAILQRLNRSGLRIRFAAGEARTAAETALLPALIREYGDLCNACVNIEADENGLPDNETILRCAAVINDIARTTPRGEGNFNFTVNFNCPPLIPYFPAGYHRSANGNCLVVGLETPALLAAALRNIANPQQEHTAYFQTACHAMRAALQYHTSRIHNLAEEHSAAVKNWTYAGIDTSAAPSKNCTSIVEIYRLLRVPYFGAAGTVEASALLTRVFKSQQNIRMQGFCGLMLAPAEDEGLAAAARAGSFDIRALLTYSSVCGIGLDTVPIPGDTPPEKTAAIMRDTAVMAYRLNKPLTVRLFPIPA